MKKYFFIPLFLLGTLSAYPRCSTELSPALRAIYQFPTGKKLLKEVEADGPIQIYQSKFNGNSHAMWLPGNRSIVLNVNGARTFGQQVRSIFFELHNAKSTPQFSRLDWLARNRHLSKHEYVEAIERLEHKNALTVAHLIDQAIRQGYFPRDAWWPIAEDFATHFQIQKKAGHSGKIAQVYDSITRSSYYVHRR